MEETEWILELTITELYELRDILTHDNLFTYPSKEKLDTAKAIRVKVDSLIEEIETEDKLSDSE